MKKILFTILFITISMVNLTVLKANCDYDEIDALSVDYLTFTFNNKEEQTVRTNVTGITDKIYAVVINDYNDEVRTYHYSDTNEGRFSFDTDDINSNINYIIRIYTEDTSCSLEPIKTMTFQTPKYNPYSIHDFCNSGYEIEMCNPFYDIKDMTIDEFTEKLEAEYDKIKNEENKDFAYYISKYYLFVLIPLLLVIIIFIIRIILLKRGNKNE